MAKLHHLTLKSAVNKYRPFIAEGMSEEGVKALIADDEKEYTEDEVNEIFAALSAPESKAGTYIVVMEFRDINNFDLKHQVGADVSHFDAPRIEKLVKMGLIEKQ